MYVWICVCSPACLSVRLRLQLLVARSAKPTVRAFHQIPITPSETSKT